jgi:hypothetical protein
MGQGLRRTKCGALVVSEAAKAPPEVGNNLAALACALRNFSTDIVWDLREWRTGMELRAGAGTRDEDCTPSSPNVAPAEAPSPPPPLPPELLATPPPPLPLPPPADRLDTAAARDLDDSAFSFWPNK